MSAPTLLILLMLGQAPAPAPGDAEAARARRDFLRDLYLGDAGSYRIYRDAGRAERAELRPEPAYVWTNPVRNGGQDGHVFVWTYRGRPEAVGTIFSSPLTGRRKVMHELHSLSAAVLEVDHPGPHPWKPLQPGVDLRPIPGAPEPGRSAPQRLVQMRALAREFAATAVDAADRPWELRVLPQPLYRYESTDPDVLDGAIFTLVSSAGTDPELMIVVEARKPPGEPPSAFSWQFGAARFSIMALTVRLKDRVVFTAPLIPYNAAVPDPTHRYHIVTDRMIPPVEEAAPAASPAAATSPQEPGRTP